MNDEVRKEHNNRKHLLTVENMSSLLFQNNLPPSQILQEWEVESNTPTGDPPKPLLTSIYRRN